MKPKQLREWLFQNGQEDQWWVCIDTVTEESPLTVAEIEDKIASGDYVTVQALHVSQSEMNNPATGILIGIEASQLGIGIDSDKDKKGRKKVGPIGWVVFTLLVWIIAFPAYLGYRSHYGAKNMLVGGIAVALIFLAAFLYIEVSIAERADEIRRSFQDIEDAFQ